MQRQEKCGKVEDAECKFFWGMQMDIQWSAQYVESKSPVTDSLMFYFHKVVPFFTPLLNMLFPNSALLREACFSGWL